MTNYDQAMKHFKNHRKDKFFQQCAPAMTAVCGEKHDFQVFANDGESYLITAYCENHAADLFKKYYPGLTVLKVE